MLNLIAPVAFIGLLVIAAITDVATRKIPNWTVVALFAVWILSLLLGPQPAVWWSSLAAAVLVFAVTYGLYYVGWIGAGDAKLMSVTALFFGLSQLLPFAIFTVLAGGLVALGMLILRPKRAMRALTKKGREEGGGRGVPYGVAIAAGAIAAHALSASMSQGLRPGFFVPLFY